MVLEHIIASFLMAIWFLFYLPTFLILSGMEAVIRILTAYLSRRFEKYGVLESALSSTVLRVTLKLHKQLIIWVELFEEDTMGSIVGLRTDEIHDFVAPSQKDDSKETQVVWKVTYLTSRQNAEIQDELFRIQGIGKGRTEKLTTGTQALRTLVLGLKGWSNFKYPNGEEVVWEEPKGSASEREEAVLRNVDKIPPSVRDEIAAHVRGESMLGND